VALWVRSPFTVAGPRRTSTDFLHRGRATVPDSSGGRYRAGRDVGSPWLPLAWVTRVSADAVVTPAPLGARVVVAGTHSGVGKTTVATGLLSALRRAGHRPAAAKIGPDFIDPGYHALACGRPPRNLDPWLCGADAIAPLAARAARGSELLVIEGVMGLFDGAADGALSSTADVARMLDAPVILVVDARALSGSVAALVHGYLTFDPSVRVAGVVLNRVGSDTHEVLLRDALCDSGIPILGVLRRDDRLTWRDRHLGLVPVAEHPASLTGALDRLTDAVAAGLDLPAIIALAGSAPHLAASSVEVPPPGRSFRVGVAAGAAFTFTYTDTLEALGAAGGEVVPFDPLRDRQLPSGLDGLLIGGGFPEVYGAELAANTPFIADLRSRVRAGLVTWAECGGLLLLARSLDGHPMAGVIDAEGRLTDRLVLGYREAVSAVPSPIGPAGTSLRGHEFHYSTVAPAGDALVLASRWGRVPDGWATASMLATYLHYHPGGDPGPLGRFAAMCARS
jgi:cobyrinic acid a,c-diamide synthase